MRSKKLIYCASIFMLVSTMTLTGQAAEQSQNKDVDSKKDKVKPKIEAKVPIVIEAEKLSFDDMKGDLFAQGNVSVVQDKDKILTDFMRGNTKQTEIWIDGKADFFQLKSTLTGTGTHYNYTTHVGSMHNVTGKIEREHISGKTIEMAPEKMVVHDGTTTECPAKLPDYHVSAEKIEIWPGDKMIAHNAKFWIKDTVIFSLKTYQTSLQKGQGESPFPRVGYYKADGAFIRQYLEFPIGDHVAAYTDFAYYSKAGFKPKYGLINREKNYSLNLMQGDYRDGDGHWIKKEPELKFDLYSKKIGTMPISYTFDAIYGKWTDGAKTSWHQAYTLYFSHDPIKFSDTLSLNVGTGIENIQESYDHSSRNVLKFDGVLTKQWSSRFETTAEYHSTTNNNRLFNYNAPDIAKEVDLGFKYKIDRMNSIGIRQRYDLDAKRIYDQDYTWYRDLHCWQAAITYRAKRQSVNVDFSIKRW